MTDTTLENIEALDFEFELPCDIKGCENVAEYKGITKCCGGTIFMCQEHVDDMMQYSEQGGRWFCEYCDTKDIEGVPFTSIDKIRG